jgi:lipopolysaccharide transport system ATP-binding protein
MSDPIITVENLGKRYSLRHEAKAPYHTLREALAGKARRMFSAGKPDSHSRTQEDFWALRDVNFTINRGDVVGIIGRNGAGKSTLLKILSRITEPTTGRIRLGGRVASLLEVGTGFHPELSGRENIFLNGAILGMSKSEIRSKFDEIVAFAEVEKFLDTPVKHYSSGMYVRLAFAVAAHLEPEILVVDEVLAVGDAQFQQKCLQKMNTVATQGRTVLFVSHNMAAVLSLCSRALLLNAGRVQAVGTVQSVLSQYQSLANTFDSSRHNLIGSRALFISAVRISTDPQKNPSPLLIDMDVFSRADHKAAFIAFDILASNGVCVMQALPTLTPFIDGNSGKQTLTTRVEMPPLIPGRYSVSAWAGSHFSDTLDFAEHMSEFEVTVSPTPGRAAPHTYDHGFIVPPSTVVRKQRTNHSTGADAGH